MAWLNARQGMQSARHDRRRALEDLWISSLTITARMGSRSSMWSFAISSAAVGLDMVAAGADVTSSAAPSTTFCRCRGIPLAKRTAMVLPGRGTRDAVRPAVPAAGP